MDHDNLQTMQSVLERARTQSGENLMELSQVSRVLLVFLRHAGCAFCRETIADIAASRSRIEQTGARIVFVHMDARLALPESLSDVLHVRDPQRDLYQVFGLKRARFGQLMGFKVWWRAIVKGALARHGVAWPKEDPRQMPGIFLLDKCTIVRRFRHRTAADRPDYTAFCQAAS